MRHPDRFKHWLARSAVVALPALAIVTGAHGANLVANGDFETGAFAPAWTRTANSIFTNVCKAGDAVGPVTCAAHGGDYAMAFGQSGSAATLSQTIATVAGQDYQLAFWLRNDNPDEFGTETFEVLWDGVTIYSRSNPPASFGYLGEIIHTPAATSGSTLLTFSARHDPAQWFLDDVSVVTSAVPEADSVVLFGLGLVGLAVVRKARSKRAD